MVSSVEATKGKVTGLFGNMRKSYVIALSIIGVAALWVLSGQFGSDEPIDMNAQGGAEEVVRSQARVVHLVSKPITRKVVVQGETQPNRNVEVKAKLRGTVMEATQELGAKLGMGEPIFIIEDTGQQALLEKAKAALELRQAEFEAAKSLTKKGINSRIRLTEATSNLKSAEAELNTRQIDVDNLIVDAPFDGVLDDRMVEVGDSVDFGRSVARVVELDPIKIVGQISEANVGDIKVGMTSEVTLVDGQKFDAVLTFRASTSDSETRTFEIELQAPNPEGEIISGLTATIKLSTGQEQGHLVAPSALTLSDDGRIGVKIVDDEDRVRFMPITILDEGVEGTWIAGLPDEIDLVSVGQDFVADGELVERVFVDQVNSGS